MSSLPSPSSDQPVSAYPRAAGDTGVATTAQPASRRRSRRLTAIVVAALVVLAGAAVGVYYYLRDGILAWDEVAIDGIPAAAQLQSIACTTEDECWLGLFDNNSVGLAHLRDGTATFSELLVDHLGTPTVVCRATDDCWWVGGPRGVLAGASESFQPGAYHYDGSTWSVDPSAPAGQYSCSPQSCVVTTGADTYVWDGESWLRHGWTLDEGAPVFCQSGPECVSLDFARGEPSVVRFSGGETTMAEQATRREFLGGAKAMYCNTVDECVGVYASSVRRGLPMSRQSWVEVVHLQGGRWVDSDATNRGLPEYVVAEGLACTSVSNCVLVGARVESVEPFRPGGMGIWQWDGAQWRQNVVNADTRGLLLGVSCGSPRSCYAFGIRNNGYFVLHGSR